MAAQHLYRPGCSLPVKALIARLKAEGLPTKPDRTGYGRRKPWRVDVTPTVILPRIREAS